MGNKCRQCFDEGVFLTKPKVRCCNINQTLCVKQERSFGFISCWKCSIVVAFYVTLHDCIYATYYIHVKRWFKQLISFLFIFEDIMALHYISKLIQHWELSPGKDGLLRHVAVITIAVPLKKKYHPWQYWKTLFSDIFKLLFSSYSHHQQCNIAYHHHHPPHTFIYLHIKLLTTHRKRHALFMQNVWWCQSWYDKISGVSGGKEREKHNTCRVWEEVHLLK